MDRIASEFKATACRHDRSPSAADVEDEMTTVYADQQCPARQPGLNHTMNGYPGDPCAECGAPCYPRRARVEATWRKPTAEQMASWYHAEHNADPLPNVCLWGEHRALPVHPRHR